MQMDYEQSTLVHSEQQMQALGQRFALALMQPTVMTLRGELGVGKSALARAVIHGLGYRGSVKSPTYTLVETYRLDKPRHSIEQVAHLDLYRLANSDELYYIGYEDIVEQHQLVIVEWPERADGAFENADIQVLIEYGADETRRLMAAAKSDRHRVVVHQMIGIDCQ